MRKRQRKKNIKKQVSVLKTTIEAEVLKILEYGPLDNSMEAEKTHEGFKVNFKWTNPFLGTPYNPDLTITTNGTLV